MRGSAVGVLLILLAPDGALLCIHTHRVMEAFLA
ncbi:hypothetical protein GS393_04208 [Pseudomonas savastanoi pv. phaseolicola]|nr:hypothetical protein [Pseudomonas savastanoi pv. phaseolicola]